MTDNILSTDRFYAEICSSIRATDDISFKLMGFVPLVSGAALLTFFLKEKIAAEKAPLVVALALFAALVTLGLFRWELRNIQTCSWLRRRAEALEEALVNASGAPRQPKPPLKIGKTEAEKLIYSVTVLAWLIMPMALVGPLDEPRWLLFVYVAVAGLIVILTTLSTLGSVRLAQSDPRVAGDVQASARIDRRS
jgi:hypothetical protein